MAWVLFPGIAEFLLLVAQDNSAPPSRFDGPDGRPREAYTAPSSRKPQSASQDEPDRFPKVETFGHDASPRLDGDAPAVRFEARGVWASIRGTASAHNDLTHYQRGEDLDLRGDFGLDQGAGLTEFVLDIRMSPRHKVALGRFFGTYWARTTLDRTFEYNDNSFQSGERARTTLDIDNLDAGYDYQFLDGPGVTLWMGVGARWAYVNVGLASTTLDPHGSMEESRALYPSLRVEATRNVGSTATLRLEARGSPSALSTLFEKPSLGRFIEARATMGWKVAASLFLEGGVEFLWQRMDGKVREHDQHFAVNRVDLMLLGPMIGLRLEY